VGRFANRLYAFLGVDPHHHLGAKSHSGTGLTPGTLHLLCASAPQRRKTGQNQI
jgi:hypothetical protein